jgi:type IV pilus assembly protein PilA
MPRNGERGFTLIELLVVILIIGILTAIALPMFLNQRAKAQDAEAKAAASVASRAFEIYHQDHDTFAGATVAELEDREPSLRNARDLAVTVNGTADGYTIKVDSASGTAGGGPYRIDRRVDDTTRTCDGAGKGGCPDTGEW